MPKILDDVLEDCGDWWWRLRTPEGARAFVLEREGSFYNKYRARLWRTTDAGKGFVYAGHDLVIVPHAFVHKFEYGLERVAGEEAKEGNPAEPEHGRPKDMSAARLAAERERNKIRREFTGVELGVLDGEWLIGVVNGEMVACPFSGTGVPLDVDELESFFHSHVMTDLATEYERLRAGGFGSMLRPFLIVAALLIVGYVVYHFVIQGHGAGAPGNITPTLTPPPGTPVYGYLRGLFGA